MTDADATALVISFHSGDDFVKYMVTKTPQAATWSVTLRSAVGRTVPAELIPTGDWISAYHQITAPETAWIVDSYLLEGDEKCHDIEIRVPGRPEPFLIPYPYRDLLLS